MALTDSEKKELAEYVLSQLKSGAENIKEITEINNASNVSSIVGYNKDGNMVKINQMYIPRPLGSFTEYEDFITRLDELWYDETNVFQKDAGDCKGFFTAFVNSDVVEVKSTSNHVKGGQWQQCVSGFFRLKSDGTLERTAENYTTIFRRRSNGEWSKWVTVTSSGGQGSTGGINVSVDGENLTIDTTNAVVEDENLITD